MNISQHWICWFPKFFSKNEKKSTHIICPKYIGQNKNSQTNEYFSSILRTVFFRNFLECPILNLIVRLSAKFLLILSQNNKKILTQAKMAIFKNPKSKLKKKFLILRPK